MASLQKDYSRALVVKEENIKRLYSAVEDKYGSAKIETECSDGISRPFESFTDFAEFDNPKRKSIEEIKIKSDEYGSSYIKIIGTESRSFRTHNVRADLEGEESDLASLDQTLMSEIEVMRPWYYWVTGKDFVSWGIYGLLMMVLAANAIDFVLDFEPNTNDDDLNTATRAAALMILLSPIGIGFLLNWIQPKYFPRTFFAIGHGERRYEKEDKLRLGVIIGAVIPIVVGIILQLI